MCFIYWFYLADWMFLNDVSRHIDFVLTKFVQTIFSSPQSVFQLHFTHMFIAMHITAFFSSSIYSTLIALYWFYVELLPFMHLIFMFVLFLLTVWHILDKPRQAKFCMPSISRVELSCWRHIVFLLEKQIRHLWF